MAVCRATVRALALVCLGLAGAPSALATTEEHLSAIACPSSSLCVAADEDGNVFTSAEPASGSWSAPAAVDPGHDISDIACPTTAFCAAVDGDGNIITSAAPSGGASAWKVTNVDPITGHEATIACPSSRLCVMMDEANDLATSTEPTAGASTSRARSPGG
jgi:hypothetical protein